MGFHGVKLFTFDENQFFKNVFKVATLYNRIQVKERNAGVVQGAICDPDLYCWWLEWEVLVGYSWESLSSCVGSKLCFSRHLGSFLMAAITSQKSCSASHQGPVGARCPPGWDSSHRAWAWSWPAQALSSWPASALHTVAVLELCRTHVMVHLLIRLALWNMQHTPHLGAPCCCHQTSFKVPTHPQPAPIFPLMDCVFGIKARTLNNSRFLKFSHVFS